MTTRSEARLAPNDWFVCPTSRPAADLRLICVPFAGGGASTYVEWTQTLPNTIEVQAVQPPGHESRIAEDAPESMERMVAMLSEVIPPLLDRPFALFGHSLGALVAFELAHSLRRRDHPEPSLLFVSGCRAPHLPAPRPHIHDLPDDEFAARIRSYDGTPEAIFEDPELRSLFLPILRADLTMRETYECTAPSPLGLPISAHGGLNDPIVDEAQLRAWGEQTSESFDCRLYDGGHFYLDSWESSLLHNLLSDLEATGLLS